MSLRVHFEPPAQHELQEAQQWYDIRQPGLGREFLEEVDEILSRAKSNPKQFPVLIGTVRRCLVKRFHYVIVFEALPNDVLSVVAVAHTSRRPMYWRGRNKK